MTEDRYSWRAPDITEEEEEAVDSEIDAADLLREMGFVPLLKERIVEDFMYKTEELEDGGCCGGKCGG